MRGLSANLGEVPADTFFKDQHPDLKADYIMANPPFNLKDWRAADELVHDGRWNGYDTPPVDRDEVYKEIFEQAENFKKYQGGSNPLPNYRH